MLLRRLFAVVVVALAVALLGAAPGGASADSAKCTAYALLKPGNEVPPSGSRASGAALVHIARGRLAFTVAIANPARESFFAGHVHVGAAGVNGPTRVTLFSGSTDRRLIAQYGTIDIGEETAALICGDVSGHYINYHTTDFPGGAIRGQLVEL
jgi:CHRD domain